MVGVMVLRQSWSVGLILILLPCGFQCLSVHFQNQLYFYAIPNQQLVLEAQIDSSPTEQISMVTWDREKEAGLIRQKIRVAEFPGRSTDSKVIVEKHGATLRLDNFHKEDCGIYTISVTDRSGESISASCIVREYEMIHHVSVAINVSHSSLLCREAWGTEPKFNWLHERVKVTEEVGRVSDDGMTLYLSSEPCGHFTCVVSNRLGQSSATYIAEPCETHGSGTVVAVVFLIILLLCASIVAFFMWRKRRRYTSQMERLTEPCENHL